MAIGKVALNSIQTAAKSISKTSKVFAKSAKPAFKIRQTGLFSADKSLFPFAKYHPLEDAAGKLREDGMVLCRMTKNLPTSEGKVLSFYDALGYPRNSVHFSINHPVEAHWGGDWDEMPFGILMPMESTLRDKANKFLGGIAQDFYSIGSVKIPKGTVIVRHAKDVPAGKLRVINARKIEEFKKLKGVKIIETSEENIRDAFQTVIRKLGYETKFPNASCAANDFCTEEVFNLEKKFVEFLKSKGLRSVMHSYTPDANIAFILNNIRMLANDNKAWKIIKSGNVLFDYKREILKTIDDVKMFAEQKQLPVHLNIDTLKTIIARSDSPSEAYNIISKDLKINMHSKYHSKYPHLDYPYIQRFWENMPDIRTNNAGYDYCNEPSLATIEHLNIVHRSVFEFRFSSEAVKKIKEIDLPQIEQIRKQEMEKSKSIVFTKIK